MAGEVSPSTEAEFTVMTGVTKKEATGKGVAITPEATGKFRDETRMNALQRFWNRLKGQKGGLKQPEESAVDKSLFGVAKSADSPEVRAK